MAERWKTWLEDRAAHRRPVDDHFHDAISWCVDNASNALELGPGPENDLAVELRLLAGVRTLQADTAIGQKMAKDVIDISFEWESEDRLPWPDEGFDAVRAREVMEHVPNIFGMVREIHRVLKPGGRFWFSTPFIFPLHDYDSGDYWRLSPKAWEWLLRQVGFPRLAVHAPDKRYLWGSWQYPVTVLGWGQK